MRALPPLSLALALACPAVALAQGFSGRNLDVYQGPVVSSGRITGLGGAFTGVAEGQDGQPFNPAALAQRDRRLEDFWDWDIVFTLFLPGLSKLQTQDFDNDGAPEVALDARNTTQLGLMLQIEHFGMGLLLRDTTFSAHLGNGDLLETSTQDVAFGVAYGFWHDQALIGAELVAGGALVKRYLPGDPTELPDSVNYAGARVRPGILYRPRGQPVRFGMEFDPGLLAGPSSSSPIPFVQLPPAVSIPAQLRVGVSAWVGPNARHFNAPSPHATREEATEQAYAKKPSDLPQVAWEDTRWRPVMVAFDCAVIGRSDHAIGIGSYLRQGGDAGAEASGEAVNVVLHGGIEWEGVPSWLIVRAGSYLEPSRFEAPPRPHGTVGFDVKVPFWPVDLHLGASGDFAARYRNVSLSLGTWHSVAPIPPTPVPSYATNGR